MTRLFGWWMTCYDPPCKSKLIQQTCPPLAYKLWMYLCTFSAKYVLKKKMFHDNWPTLWLVTSFWFSFVLHLNSFILSIRSVWFIQQLHWAVTSSVRLWHLKKVAFRGCLKYDLCMGSLQCGIRKGLSYAVLKKMIV